MNKMHMKISVTCKDARQRYTRVFCRKTLAVSTRMQTGYVWEVLRTRPHLEPLEPVDTIGNVPMCHFILNEAKHVGHAAHRQQGMSVALDTVTKSLYFAQEFQCCVLKCHPLKLSSECTEAIQEHRQVSWVLTVVSLYLWAGSGTGRTHLAFAPRHTDLWKMEQSLLTFLLEAAFGIGNSKGSLRNPSRCSKLDQSGPQDLWPPFTWSILAHPTHPHIADQQ